MSVTQKDAQKQILRITKGLSPAEIDRRLAPKFDPAPPRVPGATKTEPEVVDKRWTVLPHTVSGRAEVADPGTLAANASYARNIENFIGTVKVPVGLVGPLRINGLAAQGDYYVPLATTEAALVASYHRGACVITESGGCSVLTINEGVSRAPAFAFRTLLEAGRFVQWCLEHESDIREAAESTTSHGRLQNLRFNIEGNHVYLLCEFTTGDASGQNMVTIAAQAICNLLEVSCPIKPVYGFVESNFSGDKKSSTQSFQTVRGKKVTAEVRIPRSLIKRLLHTTPEKMVEYWRISAMGGVLSGTVGVQGHYANGLAALFIACGQDAACVSEAAMGVTRLEVEDSGDGLLYACVTLPNLIVGTIGGGTGLPSQRACLDILGLAGSGKATAFAEVCVALVLAGELSITAALCANQFTKAHARLARGRPVGNPDPKPQ
jgi:hydroxymethylglutaryl-CoA reductase (NADPH)